MMIKRISPFILMMLILAGCYQQSNDTFDTVDSQGSIGITQIVATETSTQEVLVIDPNATPDDAVVTEEVVASPTEEIIVVASPTTEQIAPTVEVQSVQPTATVRVIQPTASPTTQSAPPTNVPQDTQPTATQQTVIIITPDTGPSQLTIPTATPTTESPVVNNGLPPTPTAIGTAVSVDCQYIIASGDNLFRIALNNNVALSDLLAINDLTENSIIQPGQVLTLPDCEVGETTPTQTVAGATVTATVAGQQIHIVASGETLLVIARRYGVTVNEILAVNNLPDPNRLTIGQQIIIPTDEE